ncbi:MAG: type IV pilin N-terminal domain-containing protein [Methanoregula sp.]|nr:type IV pilin N-terminal domain-containing protein [Methanoregula sp.]
MEPVSHDAVSPVIGVMLMLVVVIIIAAVVSAFASGTMGNTAKPPSATIKGIFSQSGGMQIIHTGGDVLPTANLVFTVSNDASFGQALGTMTTQVLDKKIITDSKGNQLINTDGTTNVTSLGPGQTLYISQANLAPKYLQPQVVPNEGTISFGGRIWTYTMEKPSYWKMCFVNPDNVGKTFTLLVSDKSSGAVVARNTVVVEP